MSALRVALQLPTGALEASAWPHALADARAAGFAGVALPLEAVLQDLPPAPPDAPGPVVATWARGLTDGQAVVEALNAINPLLDALAARGCETLVVSEPGVPERLRVAGRVHDTGARALRDEEWRNLADALDELGARCRRRGLALAFAPRAGSWIETPVELKRLLNSTEAELVGLSLDTGHVAYGGGNAAAAIETWRWRLRHVHLQGLDTSVLDAVLRHGLGFEEALRRGVFQPPAVSNLAARAVVDALVAGGFEGWLTLGPKADGSAREARAAVTTWVDHAAQGG